MSKETLQNNTGPICNTTCILNTIEVKHEEGNVLVIFILLLICTWIVVANLTVALVFFSDKRCRKNVFSSQILSLSITDLQVGVASVAITMTYVFRGTFLNYNCCAFVFFYYLASQNASMYHIFTICLHRFLFIYNLNVSQVGTMVSKNTKHYRLLLEICLIWVVAGISAGIPFALFQRFGTMLPVCSLNTLFGHGYETMLTLSCSFLMAPQIVVSFLYCGLYIRLASKWRSIAVRMGLESRNDVHRPSLLTQVKNWTVCNCRKRISNEVGHCRSEPSQPSSSGMKQTPYDIFIASSITSGGKTSKKGKDSKIKEMFHKHHPALSGQDSDHTSDKVPCYSGPSPSSQSAKTSLQFSYLRPYTRNTKGQSVSHPNINRTLRQKFGDQKRIMVTIGILLLVLNICVTPLDMLFVIERRTSSLLSRRVKFLLLAMSLMNSAINPLIYAFRLHLFRESCISVTRKIFRRRF